MEQYLYAGETEKIIGHALDELGLDYAYLKNRLELPHGAVEHLKSKNLSASQWIGICDALYTRAGSISYGYNRREHKAQLRFYWERGLLDLPATKRVKQFIREIKMDRREKRRFQNTCYSRGLRFRIFYRTLGPNLLGLLIRVYNQSLIRLQRIDGFPCMERFVVLPASDPGEARTMVRRKSRWSATVIASGLSRFLSVASEAVADATKMKRPLMGRHHETAR